MDVGMLFLGKLNIDLICVGFVIFTSLYSPLLPTNSVFFFIGFSFATFWDCFETYELVAEGKQSWMDFPTPNYFSTTNMELTSSSTQSVAWSRDWASFRMTSATRTDLLSTC